MLYCTRPHPGASARCPELTFLRLRTDNISPTMDSRTSTTMNTPMPSSRDTLDSAAEARNGATAGSAISTGTEVGVVPEGKVAVWDDTMKQIVVKDREDVRLQVQQYLATDTSRIEITAARSQYGVDGTVCKRLAACGCTLNVATV